MKKMILTGVLITAVAMGAACNKNPKNSEETQNQMETVSLKEVNVELGEYKGIEIALDPMPEITDEEVEAQMNAMVESSNTEVVVKDRAIAAGDLVSIDYSGTVNGQESGDAETNYYVTIGSGVFFNGAEEALIGKKGGEVVDIPVTYPEDYPDAAMAGKEAVYKVTVNGIVEYTQGELTDEYVATISECKTVDEFREMLKTQMEENVEAQWQMMKEEAVWEKVLSEMTVEDYPEELKNKKIEEYKSYDQEGAELEGLEIEDYVKQYFDMTMDEYNAQIEAIVMEEIKTEMAAKTIAEKEGIDGEGLTEEELMMKVTDFLVDSAKVTVAE